MTSRTIPMASTVVDSILFRDAFGTAKMRELFSDYALVQRYIDVEVALAKAEARVGVIPADAAEVIARESRSSASTSITCATRPTSSAIRSCRSCTNSSGCAARQAAMCIGAPRRRTSWTPPSRSRCGMRSTCRRRYPRTARDPGRPVEEHRDTPMAGRPPAAGLARDLRLQGRDLARDV